MRKFALALILLVLAAWPAHAQPVTVVGPITPGDCTVFSSTTILKDAGFACPIGGPPLTSAAIDAICSTNNDFLIRLSGTWQCGAYSAQFSVGSTLSIASLAWSLITGTPTTLAGYGITNARTQLANNISLYVNGNSFATNSTTASGNNTLHFASTNSAFANGSTVADLTTPSAIPNGTTVSSSTGTTVVMSANAAGAGVGSGDLITVSAPCGPAGVSMCNPGNDANNCLTPTTACLTLQNVYGLIVGNYDFAYLYTATAYLAHSTGTNNYVLSCTRGPIIGNSVFFVRGDSSAQNATVIVDPAGGYGLQYKNLCTVDYHYIAFADSSTNDGAGHIFGGDVGNAGHLDLGDVTLGPLAIGIQVTSGSLNSITATGPFTINGGAAIATVSEHGGSRIDFSGQTVTITNATVTISIASPAVVTWTAHGQTAGAPIAFATTGALPTGLTAGTIYYVTKDGSLTANAFHVSDTSAHALAGTNTVNTSGSQSGVQTEMPGFSTAFAFMVDDGVIGATNTTFSGLAAGTRCLISGPLNLGGYNCNAVFPGNVDGVQNEYIGAIGLQTGSGGSSSFNYGTAGHALLSGGSGSAKDVWDTAGVSCPSGITAGTVTVVSGIVTHC